MACRRAVAEQKRRTPCVVCKRDSGGHAGGRCKACYGYWQKHGVENVDRNRCYRCRIDLSEDRLRPGPGQRFCEKCEIEGRRAVNRRKNAKRRGARTAEGFTVEEIAERDGWRCHLCGQRVRKGIPATSPAGPTIDHLVPIAAGGQDVRENVALAHRRCNVRRQDRGSVQLRLAG